MLVNEINSLLGIIEEANSQIKHFQIHSHKKVI